MALIECPECKREISDKATSCPHCGVPIRTTITQSDGQMSTIQLTKKKYKLQKVFITIFLILGIIFLFFTENNFGLGLFLFIGSAIWLIILNIVIWWHHK